MELGGVSEVDINKAEKALGLKFAEEYREYLSVCGIATADGHEFTGVGKSQRLNVIEVTNEHRSKNENIPDDLYVIEDLSIDKIVIWQSVSGAVYQTVGNNNPEKISKSLCEFLA